MEEKIKLANVKTSESDNTLHRKYQELMGTVQGKEDLINRLETQLAKQVKIFSTVRPVPFMSWRDSKVCFKSMDYVSITY